MFFSKKSRSKTQEKVKRSELSINQWIQTFFTEFYYSVKMNFIFLFIDLT